MPIRFSFEEPLIEQWTEDVRIHLDLRPLLWEGGEPFPYIMEALEQLEEGQILILHVPFEPYPLYRVLMQRGFLYRTLKISEDHYHVEILKGTDSSSTLPG